MQVQLKLPRKEPLGHNGQGPTDEEHSRWVSAEPATPSNCTLNQPFKNVDANPFCLGHACLAQTHVHPVQTHVHLCPTCAYIWHLTLIISRSYLAPHLDHLALIFGTSP